MSETVNQEQATVTEQPKEEVTEKLFTQDEVNSFFNKRYSELMSQVTEYKTKAQKFDEMEEANKSELQKATEKAEKLEAELNQIKKTQELKEMREKVAKEAEIPMTSMSLLTAETEEACMEQAKIIKSMMVPGSYPTVPDGGELQKISKGTPKDMFKQYMSQIDI